MNWDKNWEKKKIRSDYSLKLYNFLSDFSKDLPPNAKILEAGCGSGEGLTSFEGKFAVGLDLSKEAINLSRKKQCTNLVVGDNFNLPFKDDAFDFVYNSGVIEHFKYPKNLEMVREMKRVTKRKGRLLILVPNGYCLWYLLYKKIGNLLGYWRFGYEEDYTVEKLKKVLLEAGLKVEKKFGLQALIPLATNYSQILPEEVRKVFVHLEKIFPFKQYYAYSLGMIVRK